MDDQFMELEERIKASTLKMIGQNIRARRNQLGLTSDQLAHKANLDRSYISRIETGKANVSHFILLKLTHALDLPSTDPLIGQAHEEVKEFIHEINRDE